MTEDLKIVIDKIFNSLFTKRCELCGEVIEFDKVVCDNCKTAERNEPPYCISCGLNKKSCTCDKHKNEYKQIVAPYIYDENLNLFGEYENEKEKKKKYELKRNIDKLFISINSKNKWKLNNFITECPYVKGKYIIDTKYDKEIGLLLELDEGYSIDSREL